MSGEFPPPELYGIADIHWLYFIGLVFFANALLVVLFTFVPPDVIAMFARSQRYDCHIDRGGWTSLNIPMAFLGFGGVMGFFGTLTGHTSLFMVFFLVSGSIGFAESCSLLNIYKTRGNSRRLRGGLLLLLTTAMHCVFSVMLSAYFGVSYILFAMSSFVAAYVGYGVVTRLLQRHRPNA